MTITEFLLARIAEDESIAGAAARRQGARWFDEGGIVSSDTEPDSPPGDLLDMYASDGRWNLWDCEGASSLSVSDEVSAHMARHDPVRVMTECSAKRRIVWLHAADEKTYLRDGTPEIRVHCSICVEPSAGGWDLYMDVGQTFPCPTLRLLALPYADHPDYRGEWLPRSSTV